KPGPGHTSCLPFDWRVVPTPAIAAAPREFRLARRDPGRRADPFASRGSRLRATAPHPIPPERLRGRSPSADRPNPRPPMRPTTLLPALVATLAAFPAATAIADELVYVPNSTQKVVQLTGNFDRGAG